MSFNTLSARRNSNKSRYWWVSSPVCCLLPDLRHAVLLFSTWRWFDLHLGDSSANLASRCVRPYPAPLPLPHPSCYLKFTAYRFFLLLPYRKKKEKKKKCHQLQDSPEEIYYSLEQSAARFPTGNNLTAQLFDMFKTSKSSTITCLKRFHLCYLSMFPV